VMRSVPRIPSSRHRSRRRQCVTEELEQANEQLREAHGRGRAGRTRAKGTSSR
jgi:hypothetical protein